MALSAIETTFVPHQPVSKLNSVVAGSAGVNRGGGVARGVDGGG
jgi:hypothetical protein